MSPVEAGSHPFSTFEVGDHSTCIIVNTTSRCLSFTKSQVTMDDTERRTAKRSRFDQKEPEPKSASRFDRRSRSPQAGDSKSRRSRSPLDRASGSPASESKGKSGADAAAAAGKIYSEQNAKSLSNMSISRCSCEDQCPDPSKKGHPACRCSPHSFRSQSFGQISITTSYQR